MTAYGERPRRGDALARPSTATKIAAVNILKFEEKPKRPWKAGKESTDGFWELLL